MQDRKPFIVACIPAYKEEKKIGRVVLLRALEDFYRTVENIIDNFKPGEVYNLGGDRQYKIKQVSDLILRCIGRNDSKVT